VIQEIEKGSYVMSENQNMRHVPRKIHLLVSTYKKFVSKSRINIFSEVKVTTLFEKCHKSDFVVKEKAQCV
jgi:hypothetical protein